MTPCGWYAVKQNKNKSIKYEVLNIFISNLHASDIKHTHVYIYIYISSL